MREDIVPIKQEQNAIKKNKQKEQQKQKKPLEVKILKARSR